MREPSTAGRASSTSSSASTTRIAELGLYGPDSGALLGVRNLLKNVLPLFARCDPRDIHVWSEVRAPAWGDRPTLYVFDHMPAGVGLADRAFAAHREVFATMASVI